MTDWSKRTIAPKPKEPARGDVSGFSPPLARALGAFCSTLFGLSAVYFGGRLLGLGFDYWTSGESWNIKAVGLFLGSIVVALVGFVVGLGLAAAIKVKGERANYAIGVLWHYLANGTLIWGPMFGFALTKHYGKEGVRQLLKAGSEWWFGGQLIIVPGVACLLVGGILLGTGLLKGGTKAKLLPCMLVAAPLALAVTYEQSHAFHVDSMTWIPLGLLNAFLLIVSAAYMIERDRLGRARIQAR